MTEATANSAAELDPKPIWTLFAGMAQVPRPSMKEARIREHVRSLCEARGLNVRQDETGNLVVEAPATPGHEKATPVVIQGHLDMVCEKNSDTQHDFDNDPIRLIIDKDKKGERIVRADGTTLGADNGIGVCMGLAAAFEDDVVHGPLELLFTMNEEAGMTGAKNVSPDLFKARRLINLDSEEDDAIYIGCAGGCDSNINWSIPIVSVPAGQEIVRVAVSGLIGGHSGSDIHLNRANAIKVLMQTLWHAPERTLQLADLQGGSMRNAIPREAHAVITGPPGTLEILQQAAAGVQEEVRQNGDADCKIQVERGEAKMVASLENSRRVFGAIMALPQGVLAVVPEIAGLVQTSNNVSTVKSKPSGETLRVTVGCLSRSSSKSQLEAALRQIKSAGRLGEATVETANQYPGWQPNMDSTLLSVCEKTYRELFGEKAEVTAIHAGLECGIIGERVGGMDMISFGPRIEGAHSPDERVYIESVQKSWQFLKAVLKELAGM